MTEFKALIFDVDGVVAETEKDGHRVAFNRVFREEGLKVVWDVENYGDLLKIAGGKERLKTLVYSPDFSRKIPDKDEYILKLHRRKTEIYKEIVAQGKLPARPGVARLIREAHQANLILGVASTSHLESVKALMRKILGEDTLNLFDTILAGDVVRKKKPSPEIYELCSKKLGISPENCAVIEDTRNGLLSAKGAGMVCIVTPSYYSQKEDFSEADLVASCLGDPGEETAHLIRSKVALPEFAYVTVGLLRKLF
ncbi:HAD family hydrolase [Candidatus Aerophobetes bacterium]|uniref:HAD family hydrolase n=1 Tax=Aerophobetes bacterium TaxID=2030807 RepID=A0A523RP45_UNCAE|nr:MAG: HAD family hydrolase [Candidatus Aerophobetes bacterium]